MSLPRVPRSRPRPKLRAIPKRRTEAAIYAELQQLTIEKQRLLQELEFIEERRGQIAERLGEIQQAMQEAKISAEQFEQPSASGTSQSGIRSSSDSQAFPPMLIDY
ncbi:MAG: gas vesicle protein GvpV [Cyanobacteriota bacterium]|nr:gas vesicle protein GvpV [Cyanobacteriota bacterium]